MGRNLGAGVSAPEVDACLWAWGSSWVLCAGPDTGWLVPCSVDSWTSRTVPRSLTWGSASRRPWCQGALWGHRSTWPRSSSQVSWAAGWLGLGSGLQPWVQPWAKSSIRRYRWQICPGKGKTEQGKPKTSKGKSEEVKGSERQVQMGVINCSFGCLSGLLVS